MSTHRPYITLALIIISIIILGYTGTILQSRISKADTQVQKYSQDYSFIKQNLIEDKELLDNIKTKSQLIQELQKINAKKIIPNQLNITGIVQEFERYHNEIKSAIKEFKLISEGKEDFGIETLNFYKYSVTIGFKSDNIFSEEIQKYIQGLIKFDQLFPFNYISDFELTPTYLKYHIKFYFKKI